MSKNTLILTCPDCGSIDITTVIDAGESLDRCEMCGFIGIAPKPTRAMPSKN